MTDDALDTFLADRAPFATSSTQWPSGIALAVALYCDDAIPPASLITSVRAVVCKGREVLVFRDGQDEHSLLPGGRIEAGEGLVEALHREIREETRWSIADPQPIGFIHFRHTTPKPPDYAYPYPDFLQQVYAARAGSFDAAAAVEDDWVVDSFFAPVDSLDQYAIDAAQRRFLEAAQKVL